MQLDWYGRVVYTSRQYIFEYPCYFCCPQYIDYVFALYESLGEFNSLIDSTFLLLCCSLALLCITWLFVLATWLSLFWQTMRPRRPSRYGRLVGPGGRRGGGELVHNKVGLWYWYTMSVYDIGIQWLVRNYRYTILEWYDFYSPGDDICFSSNKSTSIL